MYFLVEVILITVIPATVMNVPENHYARNVNMLLEKLQSFPNQFKNREVHERYTSATLTHKMLGVLHDVPQGIGVYRKGQASSFLSPEISKEAAAIFNFLVAIPSLSDFMKKGKVLREMVNEEIFTYSLMRAILFRNDTKHIKLPLVEEILPNSFIPSSAIHRAQDLATRIHNINGNVIVESKYDKREVTSPLESDLEYFRDDVCINSHHWNWHMLNPSAWIPNTYELRDRKGELFFYVHRQMVARYDAERASCNLPPVLPLQDLHQPILEEYFPKYLRSAAGRHFIGRSANMTLHDVPSEGVSLKDLDTWSQRIMKAINTGYAFSANGSSIELEERNGIDILSSLIESSATSINRKYYGNFHNYVHILISRISNPNEYSDDHDEIVRNDGVMAYSAVSMRDPIFYCWHKHIDNMFDKYLTRFPPYTTAELFVPNVAIGSIWVQGTLSKEQNSLLTFWQDRNISISRGIALDGIHSIVIKARHLQHEQFTHNIQVTNRADFPLTATVRILIAPKYDHFGYVLTYNDQRRMFIEMDKYSATIHPGQQVLKRHSLDSSVTTTTSGAFQKLACAPNTPESNWDAEHASHGCGWPDHMLLPKGHTNGSMFTYFVMLTEGSDYKNSDGKTASSYCGLLDKEYPDKKSMAFPFDRMAQSSKFTIKEFAAYPNIMTADLTIIHKDVIIQPDEITESCEKY